MTQEEIIEGNKFIADFMGGKWVTDMSSHEFGGFMELKNPKDLYFCDTTLLKYHSSWDWLMPVIAKIMALNLQESNDLCQREPSFYIRPIRNVLCGIDIEETWLAVVKFIKWYNNTNH